MLSQNLAARRATAHTAWLALSGMSRWLAVTLSPNQIGLFQAIKLKELSCSSGPWDSCPTEPGAGGWGEQGGWAWPLVPCLLHPSQGRCLSPEVAAVLKLSQFTAGCPTQPYTNTSSPLRLARSGPPSPLPLLVLFLWRVMATCGAAQRGETPARGKWPLAFTGASGRRERGEDSHQHPELAPTRELTPIGGTAVPFSPEQRRISLMEFTITFP